MSQVEILRAASLKLDDIFEYSLNQWNAAQAEIYVRGLIQHFDKIADRAVQWRKIPADYGVSGYFSRYESHFVYFSVFEDGLIGIRSILHVGMDQASRLAEDNRLNRLT